MSNPILPNAAAARAAAASGPDLPAFLARRESGSAPTVLPASFGPAPAPTATKPRVEPTLMPPAAKIAPAPAVVLPGVSIAEKVYSELVTLMHPRSPGGLHNPANYSAGIIAPPRGSGTVAMLYQDGIFALTFRRTLPEMGGPDFIDSYSLQLDHEAQTVTVLTRSLDLVGAMPMDQADNLSALLGELAVALDRGAAGKMKLGPLASLPAVEIPTALRAIESGTEALPAKMAVRPLPAAPSLPPPVVLAALQDATPVPAAFARTFAAIDSGAAAMPASLDTMTATEARAELAPFAGSHVMLAAGGAVALVDASGRMEPRPGSLTGGVVVSLRPSSASTGRAFPRPIDTVPAAAMLPPSPPAPRPDATEAECDALQAEAEALIVAAIAAHKRETGQDSPEEAWEVEEDAATGALTCQQAEGHPFWKPRSARAVTPRKAAAPAPLPASLNSAPAAAAPAPRARKAGTPAAPAPVPAAAPAAPKARKAKAEPKKADQGLDIEGIIGRVIEARISANAEKLGAAIDAKFSAVIDRMFRN